jgi:hypothetical protein
MIKQNRVSTLLLLAFSSNNTAVVVSGDINSNETNKCFLEKITRKEAI